MSVMTSFPPIHKVMSALEQWDYRQADIVMYSAE